MNNFNCTGCVVTSIREGNSKNEFIPECIAQCPYTGITNFYGLKAEITEGNNRRTGKKGNGKRLKKNGFKRFSKPTGSSRPCYHKHWR